ncbi:PAP/fibrillin family protein [Calothrix sp. NIES-2098]|uniref:PAP/fibrillin family protein n=1 Tax=Calothrix sp. NIES-2098 TaxID=1954171 RepID=UPI000B5FAF30|nr:PAP fibrillin [Calothrix sp. NIES-2098]
MNNRLLLKEKLQASLDKIQTNSDGPATNLQLDNTLALEIEKLATELESVNPNPYPLLNATALLDGTWQLKYSTAREIRALASLPLGLKVCQVYQAINVANKSFFNLAKVRHFLGLVSGYVKVAASFEPAQEEVSPAHKRINVSFKTRYLAIEKIVGINTPQLNPYKVMPAKNPNDRIATLDITYLDETLRIGRGGDDSLYILNKCKNLPNITS